MSEDQTIEEALWAGFGPDNRAPQLDDFPLTLKLARPINLGTEKAPNEVVELNFKEPTGVDLDAVPLNGQTLGDMLSFAARLARVDPVMLKRGLRGTDSARAIQLASNALGELLGSGGTT